MDGFLIRTGTWAIVACVLFAGVLDLVAGVLGSDARMTECAIVLLGIAALLIYANNRFTR